MLAEFIDAMHKVKILHDTNLVCPRPEKIASRWFRPGPGCSTLTTSLVNVSLKFQTLISNYMQIILLKKCEKLLQCKSFSHFFNKNISVFGYKVVIHLTS